MTTMRMTLLIALAIFAPTIARADEPPPLPEVETPPLPEVPPQPPVESPPEPPAPKPPKIEAIEPLDLPPADEKPKARPVFGRRASFAFTLENLVGFEREELSGSGSSSRDHNGFFPGLFGPRIGFHGINVSNGFTYGIGLGFSVLALDTSGSSTEKLFVTSLLPRFGFALGAKGPLQFWMRVGPSLRIIVAGDDDPTALFGIGGELYAVVSVAEHAAITLGPTFDVGLLGSSDSRDTRLTTLGLELGLLADF